MPAIPRTLLLFACLTALLAPTAHAENTPVLRVQGSNTLGAQLIPALLRAMLEQRGLANVRVQAQAAANEHSVLADTAPGRSLRFEVDAHGSSTGFSALQAGQADLAAASRPINAQEQQALQALGDMTSAQAEHVIGIDGVAVIVHPSNPLRALSLAQLAGVFSGQYQRWEQLGAGNGPIHLYARDDQSGTWETFRERVLLPHHATLAATAARLESSEALSQQVSQDPAAIGFIGLPYVLQARALAIGDGAAEPILPAADVIATEDYPLARRLYFYLPPASANPWAKALLDFTQSAGGQSIVAAQGFVAQTVRAMAVRANPGMPPAYRELARRGQRLTVNFRFAQGSATLDNKAMADVERVLAFLQAHDQLQGHATLVGFGDPKGEPERAALLSRLRAMTVRRELAKRGVVIDQVLGLGDELPVADNADEQGRLHNRRVEVWVY